MAVRSRWTLFDLVEHALDYLAGSQASLHTRIIDKAIADALRMVGGAHDWPELQKIWKIQAAAKYSTGTLSSSDGVTFTLTGGTLPSWTAGALLVAADQRGIVRYRDSDTQFVLDANFPFSGSVASGTAYNLYQVAYLPPENVRAIYKPVEKQRWTLVVMEFRDWLRWITLSTQSSSPWYVATGPNPTGDGFAVWIYPPPSDATSMELVISKYPSQPLVNYSTGTITTSGATVTLSGAGASFPTQVTRGTVLRIGTSSTAPDRLSPDGIVRTRDSNTQLTLETAPSAVTSVKYLISDPVELDEDLFSEVLHRAIETQIDVNSAVRRNQQGTSRALYEDALRRARSASFSLAHAEAGEPVGFYELKYWPKKF